MTKEIVQVNEGLPEVPRITELEGLLARKDEELNLANRRISELEQKVAEVNDALSRAVASYRALVLRTNPGIMEELVGGDSIEGIDSALEKARALVARVKQGLADEASRIRVPTGTPPRAAVDLSGLSPREKIQFAVGGKK